MPQSTEFVGRPLEPPPADSGPLGGRPPESPPPSGSEPHVPGEGADPGHETPPSGGDHEPGLSAEDRDKILAMEKGARPDPSEYLTAVFIEQHLERFDEGGTRFMVGRNYDMYGISQRDGTSFIMPKKDIDELLNSTKADLRAMEKALGLPEGYFDDYDVIRVDIEDPKNFDVRIPSGNEAGANEYWIPGGFLPQGMPEAVIDGAAVPPEYLIVTDFPDPKEDK
jgi:hypothetical protein